MAVDAGGDRRASSVLGRGVGAAVGWATGEVFGRPAALGNRATAFSALVVGVAARAAGVVAGAAAVRVDVEDAPPPAKTVPVVGALSAAAGTFVVRVCLVV